MKPMTTDEQTKIIMAGGTKRVLKFETQKFE